MMCLTIGVHLKFSIYSHQPQFGGWYGAGKPLTKYVKTNGGGGDRDWKSLSKIQMKSFTVKAQDRNVKKCLVSTWDSNPVTTTMV